ncbi:hypothetical protein DRE_01891 [Drechslerella stenobrocha 248]|uniref:non-specific serine/threonine protein kinase n=1 Tax=Drechslerella stenobrocha 248 TaxID=1043628 RepID=W7HYT9_9PEZI|nr:hypothetical protein DRE_01891 [Drechslerella stenobrocha 248]
MTDQSRAEVIRDHPIKGSLDAFRASFASMCKDQGIPCAVGSLSQFGKDGLRKLSIALLLALMAHPACDLLQYGGGSESLPVGLSRLLMAALGSELEPVMPLLSTALADDPDDTCIWDQAYSAVPVSTPPPRLTPDSLQTPSFRNTSSFANSSEYRGYVNKVLKHEIGHLLIGAPGFYERFFGGISELDMVSKAVFGKCTGGDSPLYSEQAWKGWPPSTKEEEVLRFLTQLVDQLAELAAEFWPTLSTTGRRLLTRPKKSIKGSTAQRKLDIGFVGKHIAGTGSVFNWSHILVPGELKSNPSADTYAKAWLDLARYAREVFSAQETRRFVLGFTLCGSLMRVWEFDRIGSTASRQFDVNKDGLQFVAVILGFLRMDMKELGFDPTIMKENGEQYIEIRRNGSTERLIIDRVIRRAYCIAGRATVCWKAHPQGYPQTPLVIKDSWQYPELEEEGELLRGATEGVTNVARYYHHETIQIHGADDDILGNIRRNIQGLQVLDIMRATTPRLESSIMSSLGVVASENLRKQRSSSSSSSSSDRIGRKRPSSQVDAPPPCKRPRVTPPTKANSDAMINRVHRRIILQDYGRPIYKASSRVALLNALEGCIKGHESLHKAGILHRDISINNLMINEDDKNPSWSSFLIDLDHAIRLQRDGTSGAQGKAGTRAFMAIGALLGEQHSFMHDLESIFWVLFWICIHYGAPGEHFKPTQFDQWNYYEDKALVRAKEGVIKGDKAFLREANDNFTIHYHPLIPWVNKLRREVFPGGEIWNRSDQELYSSMKEVLRNAQQDPEV